MVEQSRPQAPLRALSVILGSLEAIRNGHALFLLLGTLACAGMLLAMAETSLARAATGWAVFQGGWALFTVFYGGYAAGLVLMDEALGRPLRDVEAAIGDALFQAHRLLAVLLLVLAGVAGLLGLVAALLWAARVEVLGPWLGPVLFGATLPAGVVALALALLAVAGVVVPLAGPALWAGMGLKETARLLMAQVRQRLLAVALLTAAVTLMSSVVAGLVGFAVFSGARLLAVMAVLVTGLDLPAQQLMAGFFGYGLRSLGAAGAPAVQNAHGAAALVGGGVVFALTLVLPVLVYLRGLCAVYLVVISLDAVEEPAG